MHRSGLLAVPLVLALLVVSSPAARADTGDVHFTIAGGLAHPLADVNDATSRIFAPVPPSDPDGFALEGHVHGSIRMTVKPGVALSLDARRMSIERGSVEQRVTHFGPGVRRTLGSESVRPYVQANVLLVQQWVDRQASRSEESIGIGFMGGADLKLSDLVSIPIELHAIYGNPDRDVSTLGVEAGLTFRLFTR